MNDTGADVKAKTFTIVDVQVIPVLKLVLSWTRHFHRYIVQFHLNKSIVHNFYHIYIVCRVTNQMTFKYVNKSIIGTYPEIGNFTSITVLFTARYYIWTILLNDAQCLGIKGFVWTKYHRHIIRKKKSFISLFGLYKYWSFRTYLNIRLNQIS